VLVALIHSQQESANCFFFSFQVQISVALHPEESCFFMFGKHTVALVTCEQFDSSSQQLQYSFVLN